MRILKYFIILALLANIIQAEEHPSFICGFGLEFGAGHNSLFWPSSAGIKTPGAAAVDRNDLYITPTIRAYFTFNLSDKLCLKSFIGYNRFGGKSSESKYFFDAVELGMFTQYQYLKLLFGIGAKINRNLHVQYHHSSFNADRTDWFVKHTGNAGIRISYIFKIFCISIESWFGVNNLADSPISRATVYENHYRLMLGYKIR